MGDDNFDDILGAFNSDEKPAVETKVEEPKKEYNNSYNNNSNGYKKPYNNNGNFQKKDKEPSVWDMTSYKPEKVNTEDAKQVKTFTVFTHGKEDIDLSKIENIVKIAKVLSKKGYVFRCIGDTKDVVTTEICKIEGIKVEFYLPIRKFNEDVTEFVTKIPTLKACNVAANYHGLFNMNTKVNIQLSPIERMKLGSKVHVMLGADCLHHLELMLLVSACGHSSVVKKDNKIDFKAYGNTMFPIQVAEDTNIKVMNVNETGFGDKILTYLKDINDNNSLGDN